MSAGVSFWEPCWACRVIEGRASACIVAETPSAVAVLNPFALTPGHALVVPRRHIANIYELTDDVAGPLLSMAARIARAAKRAFSADGITLRQNNEPASDQHLFHFHLHVIPRFAGDVERFNRRPELASDAEQQAAAVRLRAALTSEEHGR